MANSYLFDQFGCGEDSNYPHEADFEKTVKHASGLISALRLKKGSFGYWPIPLVPRLLWSYLRTPIPPESLFSQSNSPDRQTSPRNTNRFSCGGPRKIAKHGKINSRKSQTEIIELYSKYHCETWPTTVPFEYRFFQKDLGERVLSSLGNFDFKSELAKVPKKSLLLKAENGFLRPEFLTDYDAVFASVATIKGKHMPFLDRPIEFLAAVEPYLKAQ